MPAMHVYGGTRGEARESLPVPWSRFANPARAVTLVWRQW